MALGREDEDEGGCVGEGGDDVGHRRGWDLGVCSEIQVSVQNPVYAGPSASVS